MSNMHIDSHVALEGAVKEIINDLEEHLKAQQEKLRVLYKEWNFWEAAGALLDFDQLDVNDLKIGELQKQVIEGQIEQLKLENDLTHMTEFARQVISSRNGSGFKIPSFPIPIPSANLFPFSAKYSHPTPSPKSYGQQMNHRRQEDFRYYLEHPEMLATMPGQVFPGVPSMNYAPAPTIAPQETLHPSQMSLTPPQTPPFPQQNPLPPPQSFILPPAQAQIQPPVQASPITFPNQIPTQDDIFFIRRITAYRESVNGLPKKGIHPTDGKRNYKLDPHFWEKNWDGTGFLDQAFNEEEGEENGR
ncbi:hypothetical protein B0T09DRAFT_340926 [Sordaria sp. MPI-SDFR-AT-0083]|nr:hypothetical protein B0T09DRAFT_340926 [Sordaria sp. MPI-SDFR-AT-0083]